MMEYRFSHRVLAPANLTAPAAGDRPYAGLGSIGAYSHFAARGFDVSFGAEAMFSGPMTGAARGQTALHNLLGIAAPSAAVRAGQIPNRGYPVLAGEIARPVALGSGAVLRPFASARAGDEAFLRAGVDLLIGSNFTSGVLLRDATTGTLYQGLEQAPENGLSFLLGADTARVFSSAWLPGATLTPLRSRARAGVQYQADHLGVFYGVSWLSREFAAQPSGQVVGALEIQLRF